MSELKRTLNAKDGVAIFIGIILGSGIFVAPKAVAAAAAHPFLAALVWLVGAAVAFAGASCYAECGARLPQTGGFYIFYREVYGPTIAKLGGWAALSVTYPASMGGIALFFGTYLVGTLGLSPHAVPYAAASAIVATGVLNIVGVRAGAMTQRLLTSIKVLALVGLCIAAILAPGTKAAFTTEPADLSVSFAALMPALLLVLWTYDGWSDVTLISGELRDPGRTLGRIVVVGCVALFAIYLTVQLSVMAILSPSEIAASERVVAAAVEKSFGASAGQLLSALVMVSTLGSVNAIALTASRLAFAMASDGILPHRFATVHRRFATPAWSTLLVIVATLVYVVASDFSELVSFFSFSVWIFYALGAMAVLVLRKRHVGTPSFVAPFGSLLPVVVVAMALIVTGGVIIDDPKRSALGALILAAGYAWLHLRQGARS